MVQGCSIVSTTPNTREIILWSLFYLDFSNSRWFDRIEPCHRTYRTHGRLHHRSGSLWCAMVQTGLEVLNHPDSTERLHYNFCGLNCRVNAIFVPSGSQCMVRGGSIALNHLELMSSSTMGLDPCPTILVPSGAQWFEVVWYNTLLKLWCYSNIPTFRFNRVSRGGVTSTVMGAMWLPWCSWMKELSLNMVYVISMHVWKHC